MINDVIVNVFFILFPLFLYQLLRLDNNPGTLRNKIFMIVMSVLSIILCMSLPISSVNSDYFFDLRVVPLILAFLYYGFRMGVLLYVVAIGYRFFLGGEGALGAFFEITILCMICTIFSGKYIDLKLKHKLNLVLGVQVASYILTFGIYFVLEGHDFWWFFHAQTQVYSIQMITSIIVIIFIEMIRKNREIRNNIIHIEKSGVVSQLAASVSHEVRNPLTVSRGFLQLLKSEDLTKEKKESFIYLAIQEIDRASDIINDYLTFAKPAMEKAEVLKINKELRYAIDMITPMANMQSVLIHVNLDEDVHIIGERQKLQQCLINLMKNSVEAMPSGGTLTVKTRIDSDKVQVSLTDTGCGMSKEQVQRLGEPYFSTKQKGTGLGMMVVFSIIEAMGGKIKINSQQAKGTEVVIMFNQRRNENV